MNENISVFKKGSYLYVEGDEDTNKIYIIQKGAVKLLCSNKWMEKITRTAGSGDIIGFVSTLCGRPRLESAIAMSDTSIIAMSRDDFINRTQTNHELAFRIINYFAKELRIYDDLISADVSAKLMSVPRKILTVAESYAEAGYADGALHMASVLEKYWPGSEEAAAVPDVRKKIKESGRTACPPPVSQGIYRQYEDNQMIFCEDEPGEELFIIKTGKVKIVRNSGKEELLLSVLKEGDIFGELAIVSDKPRNAGAISVGRTVLMPVNKEALTRLVNKSPLILKRIFKAISQRVWFTHIRLDTTVYKRRITRMYAFLKNKLMEDKISLQDTMPHEFSFGLDDFFSMVSGGKTGTDDITAAIQNDSNLKFNNGQITVINPKLLAAKALYYISRDSINDTNETKTASRPEISEPQDDDSSVLEINEINDRAEQTEKNPVQDHGNSGSDMLNEFDSFEEPEEAN